VPRPAPSLRKRERASRNVRGYKPPRYGKEGKKKSFEERVGKGSQKGQGPTIQTQERGTRQNQITSRGRCPPVARDARRGVKKKMAWSEGRKRGKEVCHR